MNPRRVAVWPRVAAAAITAGAVACAGTGGQPRPPTADLTPTHLVAPAGATLTQSCTPTGPELCFNAVDDNCNGVIDEGCGTPTGVLQFMIAWGSNPADVNLVLLTPQSERVPDERTRATPSGFHLDRDCPAEEECHGQNVEDVYFDGLEPPHGRYVVEIALGDLHGADPPVKVRFGARLGSRTLGFDVELTPGDDAKKTFSFDLP